MIPHNLHIDSSWVWLVSTHTKWWQVYVFDCLLACLPICFPLRCFFFTETKCSTRIFIVAHSDFDDDDDKSNKVIVSETAQYWRLTVTTSMCLRLASKQARACARAVMKNWLCIRYLRVHIGTKERKVYLKINIDFKWISPYFIYIFIHSYVFFFSLSFCLSGHSSLTSSEFFIDTAWILWLWYFYGFLGVYLFLLNVFIAEKMRFCDQWKISSMVVVCLQLWRK